MKSGQVLWYHKQPSKRFGFIRPSDGTPDVFVHYSALEGDGEGDLEEGDPVMFEAMPGPKGPQAVYVIIAQTEGRSK